MIQIYMQDTIDYILRTDQSLIKEIETLDNPEVKTIENIKNNKTIKYYKFIRNETVS